jgi:hypothetical protein
VVPRFPAPRIATFTLAKPASVRRAQAPVFAARDRGGGARPAATGAYCSTGPML